MINNNHLFFTTIQEGNFMICNDCNSVMKEGYIQSRDGIYWDSKIRTIAALGSISSTAIRLFNDDGGAYSGNKTKAYLCEKCKKVVIFYGSKQSCLLHDILLNADVNGALNILVKSKQNILFKRDELCSGLLASPLRIRLT